MISKAVILATDSKYGISKLGNIPWRLKSDMAFFRDVTTRKYGNNKNAVIIGKNTWKSLPDSFRGFKDRITIVVSSTMTEDELKAENVNNTESYCVKTLEESLLNLSLKLILSVACSLSCLGSMFIF